MAWSSQGYKHLQGVWYENAKSGTSGSPGYINFAELKVGSSYSNSPLVFEMAQRSGSQTTTLYVCFVNSESTDPGLAAFTFTGNDSYDYYIVKTATSTWNLWGEKSESYDSLTCVRFQKADQGSVSVTFKNGHSTTVPSGATKAVPGGVIRNAVKLQTARTISLTGDVSGSASFDGTSNVSINATVADNSHSHSNYLTTTGAAASANKLNTNAGNASQPVYFSNGVPVAATAYSNAITQGLKVDDSRNDNPAPNSASFTKQALTVDFKYNDKIGSPTGFSGNYCGVLSLAPWSETSGGNGYQIAVGYNSNAHPRLAIRSADLSAASWGSWYKIYTSDDKPTPAEIGAATSGHTHSYLPLSGGTLTGYTTFHHTNFSSTVNPSSTVYGSSNIKMETSDSKRCAIFECAKRSSGEYFVTIGASVQTTSGYAPCNISFAAKTSGATSYTVSSAALFRNALGLGNTSGALPVANGGTGTTAKGKTLLSNIGITSGTGAAPSSGTNGCVYIQYS